MVAKFWPTTTTTETTKSGSNTAERGSGSRILTKGNSFAGNYRNIDVTALP